MNASSWGLLMDCYRRGIKIWADGDRLRFRSKGPLPADLLTRLRKHKLGLLAALRSRSVADSAAVGGGCRPVSSAAVRASEHENTAERPSRLPCAGRGAAGRVLAGGQSTTAITGAGDDSDTVDLPLDATDRAALEFLRGERFGGLITTERVRAEAVEVGGVRVPAGWSRDHWIAELRRMACRCEQLHPDRAADLRRDADRLDGPG